MAAPGFAESLLGGLEANTKRALTELVRYIVPNGKFGPVVHHTKSESFQAYYSTLTTDSSTGEFSVVHGVGRAPYLLHVVMPLDSSGYGTPILRGTRPADANRVYLKADAGSTNMKCAIFLE